MRAQTRHGTGPPPAAETLYDDLTTRARRLAAAPYRPPATDLPPALAALDYDQYRSIRYRPEAALWRGAARFELQLFHPGFIHREPVRLHLVEDGGRIIPVPFDPARFRYDGAAAAAAAAAAPGIGHAGFRVHYPLNDAAIKDEAAVFLGASYFRLLGRGHVHGLSSRGLAVDTALESGEEFPLFREFWLVRPEPDAAEMTFHALLDSRSVSGAYRFVLAPGAPTTLEVDARLFARADVAKLGVAPLSSMFLYGRNRLPPFDDFRPPGARLRRPAAAYRRRRVDSGARWATARTCRSRRFRAPRRAGSGPRPARPPLRELPGRRGALRPAPERVDRAAGRRLGQRARGAAGVPGRFGVRRQRRRLLGPRRTAGRRRGAALPLPACPPSTRGSRPRRWRRWSGPASDATRCPASRTPPPPSRRRFVVDFGPLPASAADPGGAGEPPPVEAVLDAASGQVSDLVVQALPDARGWRAAFRLVPDGREPAALRLYLHRGGRRVSETWDHVWHPDHVRQ